MLTWPQLVVPLVLGHLLKVLVERPQVAVGILVAVPVVIRVMDHPAMEAVGPPVVVMAVETGRSDDLVFKKIYGSP